MSLMLQLMLRPAGNTHASPPLQVIARFGKWLYAAMYKSYLMFFKVEGLLAVGGWERAAQKDYNTFWDP